MQKIDQSLDITGNFDRRLESLIQGGSSEVFCQSGFDTWLTETVNINNSPTWEVVKVHRAVPITDLLSEPLRERINQLFSYANVVSRSPSVGSQTQFGFDGASLGVKDIKQIEVWHNGAVIQDISLVYVDNTSCGPHGFGKANPKSDTFVLARGEFITGVFIWHTSGSIASLQFIKNTSQLSALYGLQTGIGDPDVFTAGGCALLGLSGSFSSNTIVQAESVWRSDVEAKGYRSIATSFIGAGVNSTIFNDYRYLGDPSTARISQIRYRKTMAAIAGLQVTYTSTRGGNTVNHQTPLRGIEAGEQDTWTLTTGEYITQVQGKFKDGVVFQLEFLTNKGSARKFGKEEGEPFNFVPPDRNMVLYYMLGKSADLVQSLTFVWGTPPL
ncbi:hypothetical protein B0J17DRAFT_154172 [Rhizoctonia solani]|nr:hypothetical protein B0J17DRAFT_154172 [Rhizoctonia solani]